MIIVPAHRISFLYTHAYPSGHSVAALFAGIYPYHIIYPDFNTRFPDIC